MRWLAVAMVLANLVAWYWFSGLRELERQPGMGVRVNQPEAIVEPVLLSELSENEMPGREIATQAAPDTATLPVVEGGQRQSPRSCLGPLEDRDRAETLRQNLASMGVSAVIVPRQRQVGENYWVYLPPRDSRQAAVALLEELRSRGVDSFVVEDGAAENGLSLGIFSSRENARNLRRRARDEGYDARWRPLPSTVEEFWLELDQSAWQRLRDKDLSWLESVEWENREKNCQMVASGQDIQ